MGSNLTKLRLGVFVTEAELPFHPTSIPIMAPPAIQAPAIEPTFPIAVTIRTFPTLFFQNNEISSRAKKSLVSPTVGLSILNLSLIHI